MESVEVGDRIRFSVELIRQIAEEPDFTSHMVEVKEIRVDKNGSKTLLLTSCSSMCERDDRETPQRAPAARPER